MVDTKRARAVGDASLARALKSACAPATFAHAKTPISRSLGGSRRARSASARGVSVLGSAMMCSTRAAAAADDGGPPARVASSWIAAIVRMICSSAGT